jgi:hypothetical protein
MLTRKGDEMIQRKRGRHIRTITEAQFLEDTEGFHRDNFRALAHLKECGRWVRLTATAEYRYVEERND